MQQIKALLFILIFTITGLMSQQNNTEFRSTWVITWNHISSGDSPSQGMERIRTIMDNHKAANMNAVLFQIRQSGTAYYNSSFEPYGSYSGYEYPGYDPLAYAVEQAHLRGLELHAWFNTFQASSTYPGTPAAEHPEWVCRDRDGHSMSSYRALSPGLEDVREYTVNVAMEIVNNYDIDGLHLDYVRWNEHSNGLREEVSHEKELQRMDGYISDQELEALTNNRSGRYLYDYLHPYSAGVPDGFSSWEEWWRWSVTEFIITLHDSIQSVKPHVRLSPAALGKYNWSGWQGYGTVYQDAALWFNEGYVDQLTPMHYHWTSPSSFYGMLEGSCPQCWGQYIQPGIEAGRLFSAGPGSYMLEDYDVWDNHEGIINISRSVDWVDGFQFFSYGTWDYNDYWEEAGSSFFGEKTIIKESLSPNSLEPTPPTVSLQLIDSLHYIIDIDCTVSINYSKIVVYRTEEDTVEPNQDRILLIQYGNESFSTSQEFNGLQDYNGTYAYYAIAYNRYWKPSLPSNIVQTDSIPSFSPSIVSTYPAANDTLVPLDAVMSIVFSKTMDTTSVNQSISITPTVEISNYQWSNDHKEVFVHLASDLAYATDYVFNIQGTCRDINNKSLFEGDQQIQFRTAAEDIFGPTVIQSNLNLIGATSHFDIQDVITLVFNEYVNPPTVESAITLLDSLDQLIDISIHHSITDEQSILSIRPLSGFSPHTEYNLSISDELTDVLNNAFIQTEFQINTAFVEYSEITLIDDFHILTPWWQPNQSGSTHGILSGTLFTRTNEITVPGTSPSYAAQLNYVWDDSDPSPLLRTYLSGGSPRDVEFDTTYTLQCYIYGDGSNNEFRFCVDDHLPETAGSYHEVSDWLTIDWLGWRLIEWDLGSDPVGQWLGNNILEGTLRIDSFQMTHTPGQSLSEGTIYFDELRLVKKVPALGIVDENTLSLPMQPMLYPNTPNPFNSNTIIRYSIPTRAQTILDVFDLRGRKVASLINCISDPGLHSIMWDGKNQYGKTVSSGYYIYRLISGRTVVSHRMLLLK